MTEDGFIDDVLKAGLVIGSIFLGVKFLESLTKKCWRCSGAMNQSQTKCHGCGQDGQ